MARREKCPLCDKLRPVYPSGKIDRHERRVFSGALKGMKIHCNGSGQFVPPPKDG